MNDGADTTVTLHMVIDAAVAQAVAQIKAVEAATIGLGGTVGLVATGFGLLGGAILVHGVRSAMAFQQAMELVHTQAGATQQEVDRLSGAVQRLSMEASAQSAEHLAQGLYHIESAGFRGKQAMDILSTAADGARVGLASVETVSNALIGVMVSQIGGVHNATDAMAELNAVVGTGNVRMQDLAESIGTGVLPVFARAGLTIQDWGAAMATSTDNAIPAEMAATRLRMTISLMEAPSAAATAALEKIGMTQFQLSTDLRQPDGLLYAVQDLKKHLEDAGISAQQQVAIIDEAFGRSRSSSEMQLLIQESDRLANKYKQQAEAATKWSQTVSDAESTLAAKFAQFRDVVGTLIMVIGSGLIPVLTLASNVMIPMAQTFASILTAVPPLTTAVFGLAAAFAILNIAYIGGRLATSAYEFAMRNTFAVISHNGAIVNSFMNAIKMLTGSQMASVSAAQMQKAAELENAAALEVLKARTVESNTVLAVRNAQLDVTAAKQEIVNLQVAAATPASEAALLADQRLNAQRAVSSAEIAQQTASIELHSMTLAGDAEAEDIAAAASALRTANLQLEEAQLSLTTVDDALLTLAINDQNASLEMNQALVALSTAKGDLNAASLVKQAAAMDTAAARAKLLEVQTAKATIANEAQAVTATEAAAATDGLAVAEGTEAAAASTAAAATDALTLSILGLELSVGAVIAVVAGLALVLGYLAYTHIPVVHKAVDDLADRVRGDLTQALTDLGDAFKWLGDTVGPIFYDFVGRLEDRLKPLTGLINGVKDAAHGLGDAFSWAGDHIHPLTLAVAAGTGAFAPFVAGVGLLDNKLNEQHRHTVEAEAAQRKLNEALKESKAAWDSARFGADGEDSSTQKLTKATKDYEKELQGIAANALKPLDAELQASIADMNAYADKTIASAKKMSDGMIAEIDRVKNALATPLPEMKLPATSIATNAGVSTSNLVKASGDNQALVLSPEAESALRGFQAQIANWPSVYQSAMAPVLNDYKQKLTDAYNAFVSAYNGENKRHEDKIASLNDDAQQKLKTAQENAQTKLDTAHQNYVAALSGLNTTHENRLQSILQTFETNFQTALANFQASEANLQSHSQQADQLHRDALSALKSKEEADMQVLLDNHAKKSKEWVNLHKEALLAAYNRQVGLEETRYQHELANTDRQGQVLSDSFNRHVQGMTSSLQNQIDAEKRSYDEAVGKLNEAYRLHETRIIAGLQKHVHDIKETLDKSIAAEDSKHADHLQKLKNAFDEHAHKVAEALNKIAPGQVLADVQKETQKKYDNALAKATVDILLHGQATQSDIDALQKAAKDRDRVTAAENKAAADSQTTLKGLKSSAASASDELTKLSNDAKKLADNALAALTMAISHGDTNIAGLAEAAAKAKQAQTDLAEAQAEAEQIVAKAAGDLATMLTSATKEISDAINKFAQDYLTGKTSNTLPADKSPIHNLPGEDQAKPSGETVGQADLAAVVQGYHDLADALQAQYTVDLQVAKATGDYTTVLKDAQEKTKKATDMADANLVTAFLGLGGSVTDATAQVNAAAVDQEKITQATAQAKTIENQAAINAAVAAGDLSTAFDLLSKKAKDDLTTAFSTIEGAFLTGAPVTQAMINSWKSAKTAEDANTEATRQAYVAVGDYTSAMNISAKTLKDTLDEAENKYAFDLINHTGNLDVDSKAILDAAKAAGVFKAALDKASAIAAETTPATFEQASGATLKVTDEQTKLIEADTSVIKAQGDMQVAALDSIATQITDQTDIIKSQGDVSTAVADQQVKAIQDGSAVFKAQMDVSHATDASSLMIAQASLKVAQDKMRFDQMIASAAVNVAEAGMKQAVDKANFDAVDAQAKQKVLADTLIVEQLKVTLQKDQIKLAMDSLSILNDIDQALGGATDNQQLIYADQQQIAADNANIAKALQQQAIDQAAAASAEAAAKVQEAQDAQSAEVAKLAETQIANTAAIQEASDQAAVDNATAMKQADTNTADTIQAIQDANQELRADFNKLYELEVRAAGGLGRLDVTNGATKNIMDGWASDVGRNV